MRYDAVIFDLFGTLVPTPAIEPFMDDHRRTAESVGADPEQYVRAWYDMDMALKRSIGIFPTMEAAVRAVCDRLGLPVSGEQLTSAAASRIDATRQVLLAPREDAISTLAALKSAGLRRGLISDCNDEVVRVWPETPFAAYIEATAFSCQEGIKKPDRRLYESVSAKLGLGPDQCLFVGDGASPELTGAGQCGMDAVLICPPAEADIIMARQEGQNWDGPVIRSLSEVLKMV
jgi:putative hydrolase of the HAD superfamily